MPTRTLSSDSMTLHSMIQCDQMDPEVRLQIQSNIHVLFEPSTASSMHIATGRGKEGLFLAFIVKQGNLAKALTSPQVVSSEPKTTRSAAMLSLLEATEQRIHENLSRNSSCRLNNKKNNSNGSSPVSSPDPRIIRMPTGDDKAATVTVDNVSLNSAERPKEKGFMPLSWKKHMKVEQPLVRNVVD